MDVTNEGKQLGDRIAFVLPAYFFVFGIWSVASSYDYISSKWRTVRSARQHGMRQLCILLLPMVYMILYIKVQADAEDAKEMSTGIIALLFAGVEFCRTAVGLWQLHVFRHWVAANIRSLESLGYVAEDRKTDVDEEHAHVDSDHQTGDLDQGDDGSEHGNDSEGEISSKSVKPRNRPRNPLQIADGLTINDLVVDNKLSEGEIQCVLRMRNNGPSKNWRHRLRVSLRWVSCVLEFSMFAVHYLPLPEAAFLIAIVWHLFRTLRC